MTPPLVSVICTVRNGATTLPATIRSIQAQTLRDWEMVVVDDGSTDGTASLAEHYADQDRRIRLVHTPGLGRGRALNVALGLSRARLVANIDADDLAHPERLVRQAMAMRLDPDISLLCTGIVRIGPGEAPDWPALGVVRVTDVTHRLTHSNPVTHSSVMASRAALLAVGGYAPDLLSQFDYEFWVRLAASGHRIHKLELPLAAKRLHPGQAFEQGQARIGYLCRSARIQRQAIVVLNAPKAHHALVWSRVLFGLLPREMRRRLQDLVGEALAVLSRPMAGGHPRVAALWARIRP